MKLQVYLEIWKKLIKMKWTYLFCVLLFIVGCNRSDKNGGKIIEAVTLDRCLYLSKDSVLDDCYLFTNENDFEEFSLKFSLTDDCQKKNLNKYNFIKVSILGMPTITFGNEVVYERNVVFNEFHNKWYYEVNTFIEEKSMVSKILNFNLVAVPKLTDSDTIVFICNGNFIGEKYVE